MYFQDNMSPDQQVSSIVKSSNNHLLAIGQIRRYSITEVAEKVIHALISTKLDYGNSLLAGIPKNNIKRLQRLQNTAARIVTRIKKFNHITPTLRKLHWLPVHYRIRFKLLLLVYKCTRQMAPAYLTELVNPYKPERELRSASNFPLDLPRSKTVAFGDRAFSIAGPLLWNSIPPDIRNSPSVVTFKKSLKTYFFNQLSNP